jgi:hypothetical protein
MRVLLPIFFDIYAAHVGRVARKSLDHTLLACDLVLTRPQLERSRCYLRRRLPKPSVKPRELIEMTEELPSDANEPIEPA